MNYVGIDWASGRAAWCAVSEGGAIEAEGLIPADEDGLARLVLRLGTEIRACVEMMSGAIWVRDQLQSAGWSVAVAHARKVRDIAPLACKTDKVDARVLAELCRRDLAAGGAMGGIVPRPNPRRFEAGSRCARRRSRWCPTRGSPTCGALPQRGG
jgi:transposase